MAIPRYDSPQVQEQLPQGGRLNVGANPESFGVGLGQAVGRATEVVAQANDHADQVRAQSAWNDMAPTVQQLHSKMKAVQGGSVLNPKAYGADAGVSLTRATMDTYNQLVANAGEGLTGRAKTYFEQLAKRSGVELEGQAIAHETQQVQVHEVNTLKNGIDLEQDNVGQNPTDILAVSNSVERIKALSGKLAEATGITDPEGMKLFQQAQVSRARTQVVAAYLNSDNPKAAFGYFEANRADFSAHDAEKIQQHIKAGMSTQLAESKVQAVMDAMGPQPGDLKAVFPLDKMAEALRKDPTLAASPEAMTKAIASLKERFSEHRAAVDNYEKTTSGTLWNAILEGKGLRGAQALPEYKALPGDEQKAFILSVNNYFEAFKAKAERDPAVAVAQYAAYHRLLDDPEQLMKTSDIQIASWAPTLGPDLTRNLMDQKRKAAATLESMKANTLNDIPFKDIAGEYGMKVKGTLSQQHLSDLGQLRDKALEAIRAEQAATGKPLGPERKEQILRGLLVKVKTKQAGDWFSHERPLYKVESFTDLVATGEEQAQAMGLLYEAGTPITPGNMQTMIEAIRKQKEAQK